MSGAEPSLQNDVRWRLIERICTSATFNKSERLTDLLRHLTEKIRPLVRSSIAGL
jgi:hypothetical protein